MFRVAMVKKGRQIFKQRLCAMLVMVLALAAMAPAQKVMAEESITEFRIGVLGGENASDCGLPNAPRLHARR